MIEYAPTITLGNIITVLAIFVLFYRTTGNSSTQIEQMRNEIATLKRQFSDLSRNRDGE